MPRRLGKDPLIVGCVASEAALRRCARKAPADCDWIEVRLDLTGLCGGAWGNLCAAAGKRGRPVLLTIRSAREGGRWRGREAERLALVLHGLDVAAAVDLEIAAPAFGLVAEAAHRRGVKVVGSFHDFGGTPDLARMARVEARGRRMGVDVVKIFPADTGGPKHLAALKSVYPDTIFCPTGGVSLANMGQFLALPNVAMVGGSWLTPAAAVQAGDWAQVTHLARQATEAAKAITG